MTASPSADPDTAEESSSPMLLADRLAAAGANPKFCDRLRTAELAGDPAQVALLLARLNPSAMAGARARMDPRDWQAFRDSTAKYLRWSRKRLLPQVGEEDRKPEVIRNAAGSALLLAGLVALGATVAPFTLAVGAVAALVIVARRRQEPLHAVAGQAAIWLAHRGADVGRLLALGADAALDTRVTPAQLAAADQTQAPETAGPEHVPTSEDRTQAPETERPRHSEPEHVPAPADQTQAPETARPQHMPTPEDRTQAPETAQPRHSEPEHVPAPADQTQAPETARPQHMPTPATLPAPPGPARRASSPVNGR